MYAPILCLLLLALSAHANSYSTSFTGTENPISEAGNWINGGTIGLDWADVQTLANHAVGTQLNADNSRYNDSTAVLGGNWNSDQEVQATVINGNNWLNAVEEVELRLRTTIGPHSITGYELDFRNYVDGGYVAIVRWNGAINDFTMLAGANNAYHGIKTGDVIRGTIIGNQITVYLNATIVAQANDDTYANGSPGIGFWNSGNALDYGLTNFSADDFSFTNPTPAPFPSPTAFPSPTTSPLPTASATPRAPRHLHIVPSGKH